MSLQIERHHIQETWQTRAQVAHRAICNCERIVCFSTIYIIFSLAEGVNFMLLFQICHSTPPSGDGILPESLVGMCGPLPKTLTLFMTKICDFSRPYPKFRYPIYFRCGGHSCPKHNILKGFCCNSRLECKNDPYL